MQHIDGTFKHPDGKGGNLYYQAWLPDSTPVAALLVVHGLAEHSGRYGNLVNHFVPLGYAVYGLDHLGHGKSDGVRVYVDRFEQYTVALECFESMVNAWQPGVPVFLVGHSMGGLIGAYYLLEHQAGLAGAVLSGPAVKVPANISAFTLLLGNTLSGVLPKARLLSLEAAGISKDPEVVRAYVNDPLVSTTRITARLSAEMLKAMLRVTAEGGQITLPVLILNGSADRLVDPEAAKMLYAKVSSPDKTLKIYEGLYHEVYNEPERAIVLRDVENWLAGHLPASKA
jgi:acylglycerol lipase